MCERTWLEIAYGEIMKFTLKPGELKFSDIQILLDEKTTLELDPSCHAKILATEKRIAEVIKKGQPVYGINTGFGALANTSISPTDIETLQKNLILSHAAGTGELLPQQAIRLILLLKINSLARGYSGVRLQTIEALIKLFNARAYPCIPAQGSVGASGDLAPLAHLSLSLLGIGEVIYRGKIVSATEVLKNLDLTPIQLAPKEGLALINGTQVSSALALLSLFNTENIFAAAVTSGALSTDAARASDTPFDDRIQKVTGHPEQIKVAKLLRELLSDSEIRQSHQACHKIQDPYSLRCQPQVMGACLAQLKFTALNLLTEANGVSDNPLIFTDANEILSGGNFHAEYVALSADAIAISLAEIAALSERRIALLIDSNFSGLPAFLVKNAGLNSGFMLAQVTAAALASENKSLAHPASVDNIPTSANQEDHVSMGTYAAWRLIRMTENAAGIIGIELLAACQGIDFLRPLKTSSQLEEIHHFIRGYIPFYEKDRYFSPDINTMKRLVLSGKIRELSQIKFLD